jgi:hypothetical protein
MDNLVPRRWNFSGCPHVWRFFQTVSQLVAGYLFMILTLPSPFAVSAIVRSVVYIRLRSLAVVSQWSICCIYAMSIA